jgi:hypothetical protein
MTGLARLWRTHPDYRPGWNEAADDPGSHTHQDYKQRTTIWTRREAELTAFYNRFDLHETTAGEYWQCRTCGTRGEEVRLNPYAGWIDTGQVYRDGHRLHPTCTPAPEETTPCEP